MRLAKLVLILALVLASQTATIPVVHGNPDGSQIAGLQHFTDTYDFGSGPAEVNVLKVDLRQRKVKPLLAGTGVVGLDTVPRMAAALYALAGVNGDYWRGGQPPNQGDPASLYIYDHNVISRPITQLSRGIMVGISSKVILLSGMTQFGIDLQIGGSPVGIPIENTELNSVDRINPTGKLNQLAIFTSAYGGTVPVADDTYLLLIEDLFPAGRLQSNHTYLGKVTRELPRGQPFTVPPRSAVVGFYRSAEAKVPAVKRQSGSTVKLTVRLPKDALGWDWACGGFPTLVQNGRASSFASWRDPGVVNAHPRTAVALDNSGRYLYLVTVDGRYPGEKPGGASMTALAKYLVARWGVKDALNLDGGGSTTMVIAAKGKYSIVNQPSDGSPRRVAQSILVF